MLSLSYFSTLLLLLLQLPWLQPKELGNHSDHLSLLKVKQSITSDPLGVLDSWNDSVHFCNWFGIRCNSRHLRVTSMVLSDQKLVGSISPYIGNMSFLRVVDLSGNSFHGGIPQEVGRLFRLEQLVLRDTAVGGEIPGSAANCSRLQVIRLGNCSITGRIPEVLGSLKKLQILDLTRNNLVGDIPASIGNISSLTIFSVAVNNLEGQIPESVGKLKSLTFLALALNRLSGVFPSSIFNLSSLNIISTAANPLHGTLPDDLCLFLPNLQRFGVGGNRFSGTIPKSLPNCSHLEMFDIPSNNFVGKVPTDLGKLQNLSLLGLNGNNLGSNSTNDLVFLTSLSNCSNLKILDIGNNSFGGILPRSIVNLTAQLSSLNLGQNQISGTIPEALENLSNLTVLDLHENLFTGSIPSFGKFSNLQLLRLNGNRLSGRIPVSMGNLTQLAELYLSQNKLQGRIPTSIGNCRRLYLLDLSGNALYGDIPPQILLIPSLSLRLNLSRNSFTGTLPAEVGKLTNLNELDISENNFSGEIPGAIGGCIGMENLHMQGNSFNGTIPSSLASLKALKYLDLSKNNFTGKIPRDFSSIPFLYLNLSFNDLDGEVPAEGVFRNVSVLSVAGNKKICGGIPELRLPRCAVRPRKKGKFHGFKLSIIITFSVLFVILMPASLFLYWTRKSKKEQPAESLRFDHIVRVSYGDLYNATGGFSPENLIGSGSFGTVYRGYLEQLEMSVAVKVINLEQTGASKSFQAECRALRNVRHRNLVKLLTHCSSIDYNGNEFKALVYEFMPNGSLDGWLHGNGGSENTSNNSAILQRMNIATDIASALEHLHNFGENPIVHCDLKPSNVLLDENMVARLSDFGLARIFFSTISFSMSQTSTIGIKGTVGYAAPEYGTAGAASKEGDAYSFGILVLEMFTGRRPTDETFKEGLNLHKFVRTGLWERSLSIVDPLLVLRNAGDEEAGRADMQKVLISVFEIGLACSVESPIDRMNMMEATKRLNLIKADFVRDNRSGDRPEQRRQHD